MAARTLEHPCYPQLLQAFRECSFVGRAATPRQVLGDLAHCGRMIIGAGCDREGREDFLGGARYILLQIVAASLSDPWLKNDGINVVNSNIAPSLAV